VLFGGSSDRRVAIAVEQTMRPLVLLVTALTVACTDRLPVGPIPSDLLSSPETISVNGTPVVMNDVFPTTDGRRGVGVLGILQTADGTTLNGASVGTLWLIHGDQAWTTTVTRVPDPLPPYVIEKFVTGAGPKWSLGDSVDVVVEVRDSSGNTQRLRSPRTSISYVDPP